MVWRGGGLICRSTPEALEGRWREMVTCSGRAFWQALRWGEGVSARSREHRGRASHHSVRRRRSGRLRQAYYGAKSLRILTTCCLNLPGVAAAVAPCIAQADKINLAGVALAARANDLWQAFPYFVTPYRLRLM